MSGNLCRCAAYANIVPAVAAVAATQGSGDEAVPLRAGATTSTAPSPCSPATPRRAFLAGGTNLVDLMKLGVATPDLLVDVGGSPRTGSSRAARRRAAHRRRRPQQRPGRRPARPRALPGARRRRCWPAPRASCATWPPPAATCCSAPAACYFQDVTMPCNKREPGHAAAGASRALHRNPAILGALASTCVATHPSDMAVALAALDAVVARDRARTASAASRSPTCTGCPATTPTRDTMLRARRADHRASSCRRCRSPRARATARCATAPPTRSRWSRSRPRSTSTTAWSRDVGSRSAASRTSRGGRRGAEAALRGRPADRGGFRAAADAELAGAEPLPRNAFKVPLARNIVVRTLLDLAEGRDDQHSDRARSARRSTASTAAQGPRHGPATPTSTPSSDAATCTRCSATVARGRVTASTRRRREALPGVLAVLTPATRRGWPASRRRAGGPAVAPRSRSAASSSAPSSPRRRRSPARRPTWCGSSTTQQPHDVVLRATATTSTRPSQVNAGLRHRHRDGDVDGALAAAAVDVDATYATPTEHNNPMEPHTTHRASGTATR